MNDLKGIAILAMQAMIASKYVSNYVEDGEEGFNRLSKPEAIAKEALKYAKALEKEFEADYRK